MEHPVTRAVREVLHNKREQRKTEWENTSPETLVVDTKMLLNAAAIGECRGMKWAEELDLETIQGELDERE